MKSYNFNSTPDTTQNYNTPFLVLITDEQVGNASGPWADLHMYSWIEQTPKGDGTNINAAPARSGSYKTSGDVAIQPAIEANNFYIQPGTYCYIRPNGFANDKFVYEIVDFTPDTFVVVTSSSPVGGGWYSGNVQNWDETSQAWFTPERWDVATQARVTATCYVTEANGNDLTNGTIYSVTYEGLYSGVQAYVATAVSGGTTTITSAYLSSNYSFPGSGSFADIGISLTVPASPSTGHFLLTVQVCGSGRITAFNSFGNQTGLYAYAYNITQGTQFPDAPSSYPVLAMQELNVNADNLVCFTVAGLYGTGAGTFAPGEVIGIKASRTGGTWSSSAITGTKSTFMHLMQF